MTTRRDFLTGAAYLTVGATIGTTAGRVHRTKDMVKTAQLEGARMAHQSPGPWYYKRRWVSMEAIEEGHWFNVDFTVLNRREDMLLISYTYPAGQLDPHSLEEVMIDIGC